MQAPPDGGGGRDLEDWLRCGYDILAIGKNAMIAKPTPRNRLARPKVVAKAVHGAEHSDVPEESGPVVPTPPHIVRADAVRSTLAERKLSEADIADAVSWARRP
jgi:hypothetical protein